MRVRQRIPGVPVASQEEALPQERREENQGRATFPESPDVSVHSRETFFPCTASTFKPRIDSHHGGTWESPWESLVGKSRGEGPDPLIHAKGSVTLLLQLGRKAPEHALSRDEV